MNSSKFRITLDLHSVQSQHSIPAIIGDTYITLLMSPSDGGVPYTITDGCLAKLSIKRPSGSYLEEFCKISNNAIIEYPFKQNENTCAEEGIHFCDVTLYSPDGEKLGSPCFLLVVSDKVVRRDDIQLSTDDYTAVDSMVKEEAKRANAETERVNAESARASAEEERNKAESERAERYASIKEDADRVEESASRAEEAAERVVGYGDLIFRNEKRITNLENGYTAEPFITDSASAYEKTVPENALPYAEIKKLYGQNLKIGNDRLKLQPYSIESYAIDEGEEVLDITLTDVTPAYNLTIEKIDANTFKFNGYTEYQGTYPCRFGSVELAEDYYLCYEIVSGTISDGTACFFTIDGSYLPESFDNPMYVTSGNKEIWVDIATGNEGVTDLVVRFKAKKHTEPQTILIDTFEIPEEVMALDGYCCKNNYIDFERGVFVRAQDIIDNSIVTIEPPEETDIRQYIGHDNFIKVSPNGILRFCNKQNRTSKIVSEVVYMVKGE